MIKDAQGSNAYESFCSPLNLLSALLHCSSGISQVGSAECGPCLAGFYTDMLGQEVTGGMTPFVGVSLKRRESRERLEKVETEELQVLTTPKWFAGFCWSPSGLTLFFFLGFPNQKTG